MNAQTHEAKTCRTCGRTMMWRRRWRDNWDEVRYCSDACRKNKPGPVDAALESGILSLLAQRRRGATICPSEVARETGDATGRDWRELMERTRMAARRLVAAEQLEITQGGKVVDPSTARGPIRLRRPGS